LEKFGQINAITFSDTIKKIFQHKVKKEPADSGKPADSNSKTQLY